MRRTLTCLLLLGCLSASALHSAQARQQELLQFTPVGGGSVLTVQDGQIVCHGVTEDQARALQRNSGQLHVITEGIKPGADPVGLKIVLRATAQLEQFPDAKAAFVRAAHVWESLIENPITVAIDVDFGPTAFGEAFGDVFGTKQLGATRFQRSVQTNVYPTIRAALIRSAGSPQELALYNALPATQLPTDLGPATGMIYHIPAMRALGLLPAVADPDADKATLGPPPAIAFNSSFDFDFNPSDGIKAKKFDFTAVATHEIGHALGFFSAVGLSELNPGAPPSPEVLDLFRFRPGVTSETFGTAPRILSSGGDHVFFGGGAQLALSTGRPDNTGGDNNQAGHWKDHLQTGRYIGIMDPSLDKGGSSEITSNDRDAFELIGYRVNPVLNAQESELKLDDGTMDTGAIGNGLMVINRLTPVSYPATLRKLRFVVPTLQNQPNATGQPITLVYATGNSGQLPSAAQFTRVRTTVPSASSVLFLEFPISNGPTINSGDFYVGYEAPSPHQGAGFAADQSGSFGNASFYSTNDGATFAPLSDIYGGKPANALIRAIVATAGLPAPPPPPPGPPSYEPVFVPLTSGEAKNDSAPQSSPGGIALRTQYTIQVPSGASQLKIDVKANTDLDLYVKFGGAISIDYGYPVADFKSVSDNFNESITVTPSSSPALQAGTYYIMLVNYGPGPSTFSVTAAVSTSTQSQGKVVSVSAASFKGDTLAADELVAAFGSGLATTTTVPSSGQPGCPLCLPTELGGTRVLVKDSTGAQRQAVLLFVSPGQVNYVVPTGTANGTATITITSGDGTVSVGTSQISNVAPGLFTANYDGQGAPGAYGLRVPPSGQMSTVEIIQFDSKQQKFIPKPIEFGAASDQLFLVLFGTGIRNRQDLSTVSVKIGGVQLPVQFAGPSGFAGTDQVNVGLPRSLAGAGEVDLVLLVDGKEANTVRVNFR